MSVFSFPRRLRLLKALEKARFADAHVSRGVRRHQEVSFSHSVRGCDLQFAQLTDDRRAPVLPGILQALLLINNAGTRCVRTNKRNENCRFAHLSRLRSTAASKRCIRTSRATVLLSPRALSSMPRIRVRRGAAPRYPWRTHTLCTHIRRDRRPRLSFAARGNFTE